MRQTDEQFKKQIVDHLFWDDSIDASGVKVTVSEGQAVLTGSVLTYRAKDAASTAAWLVNGIQEVENHLEVQSQVDAPILTDQEIEQNVTEVLTWNADIHGLGISAMVKQGIVTLEGTVGSYWQRKKAENLVGDLLGVIGINNHLVVVPTELLTDQAIAENVQTALKNSPRVDARDIKITTNEGVVSLRGFVPNWYERLEAFNIVSNCRGVIDILNELQVLTLENS
jgi:osmotically-inducible protein OsmY